MLATLAYKAWYNGLRIYSNTDFDFAYPRTPIEHRIKTNNLCYSPLFTTSDLDKVTEDSQIYISELDIFGMDKESGRAGTDSYSFRDESARDVERFLKKRLRKLNCSFTYDVQSLSQVPVRIRGETLTIYEPKIMKWWNIDARELDPKTEAKYVEVPYDVHYTTRKLNNITGIHDLIPNYIRRIVHPIFGHHFISSDLLTIYNSYAEPFKSKEEFNSIRGMDSEFGKVTKLNEEKIAKMLATRLPECAIAQIPNSGRHDKRSGDIEILLPSSYNSKTIIIEVKGAGNIINNEIKSLSCHDKEGKVTNWASGLQFDKAYNTKHWIAYYDAIKKDVFIIPVEENFLYLRTKTKPSISKLKGIVNIGKFCGDVKKGAKNESKENSTPTENN